MFHKSKFAKSHNNNSVVDRDAWLLVLRPVLGQVPYSRTAHPFFIRSFQNQPRHTYVHIDIYTNGHPLGPYCEWAYQYIVNAPINQSKTSIQLKPICHRLYTFYTPRVCLWWASWTWYPLPHTPTPYKAAIHPFPLYHHLPLVFLVCLHTRQLLLRSWATVRQRIFPRFGLFLLVC